MSKRPTPESITICTFLILYTDITFNFTTLNENELQSNNQLQQELLEHIDNCQHELSKLVQSFVNPNENSKATKQNILKENYSINNLLSTISKYETKPYISNKLINILQSSCNSIDALIDLFDNFHNALNSSVDPHSLIGVYIRKYCLGFDELSFEYVGMLWNSTCDYVYRKQLEVDGDVSILHSSNDKTFELNSTATSSDYNNFLTNLSNKERITSLDNLHKHFDYAMITNTNQSNTIRMPYASIVLADLHHHFGEGSFSLQATQEAMKVAQQSNDAECVAYALAWLHYNKELGSEELLRQCAQRSLDYNIISLYSSALLSLARYYTITSFDPKFLWNTLSAASTRSFQSNSTSTNEAYATQISHTNDSIQSMIVSSKQHLVSSGIWEVIGHAPLSCISAFSALQSHPYQCEQHLSQGDFGIAVQKIIFGGFYGSCDQFVPSLQFSILKNDKQRKRRGTIFHKCLMQMYDLKDRHGIDHSFSDIWLHSISLLLHQWALYRGEYHNAYATAFLLQSYPSNTTNQSIEIQIQSMQCIALNSIYSKDWVKAIALTKKLCTMSKNAGLHSHHAQFLLQLSSIHIKSNKNALMALPILLECIDVCKQYSMDSLHANAVFLMSKLYLVSNNVQKSLVLIKGCMNTIRQHSSIEIQGDLYLTLSKCYMSDRKVKSYSIALKYLEKALTLFSKIDDLVHLRECYYLQARMYHSLSGGDAFGKRNAAAKKFQEVDLLLKENGNRKCCYDVLLPFVDSNYLKSE